jgi:hypothetical protein
MTIESKRYSFIPLPIGELQVTDRFIKWCPDCQLLTWKIL